MPRQHGGETVEVEIAGGEEEISGVAIEGAEGEPEVVFFKFRRLPRIRLGHRLTAIERLLKREEADVVLVAGNVALVAFEIIEWPVAALTLAVHALARTRWKALQALAEVVEEAE